MWYPRWDLRKWENWLKKKVARVSVGCYVMWEGIFDSKDIKINQANFSVTLTGKQITTIKAVDSSDNRMGGGCFLMWYILEGERSWINRRKHFDFRCLWGIRVARKLWGKVCIPHLFSMWLLKNNLNCVLIRDKEMNKILRTLFKKQREWQRCRSLLKNQRKDRLSLPGQSGKHI